MQQRPIPVHLMGQSSQIEIIGSNDQDTDPDIVYYNFGMVNSSSNYVQATFKEIRDSPLISNVNKYYFSIVRFTMDGPNKTLPIFIPLIQTGQNDVNLTVYSITLRATVIYDIGGTQYTFNGFSQQFLEWVPEITDLSIAPIPPPPTTTQSLEGLYYYMFTYQNMADMVNTAFAAAQADLQTQFNAFVLANGGALPAPLTTDAPHLKYDSGTGLFTLLTSTYGYGGADRTSNGSLTDDEEFYIYFNNEANGLFYSFSCTNENGEDGMDFLIKVQNKFGSNIYRPSYAAGVTPPGTVPTYWETVQDYPSTSTLWSPIESVVFTSMSLPVVNEEMAQPTRFGDGNLVPRAGGTNFANIITDIALSNDTGAADYRQMINYTPSVYRLAAMDNSGRPLQNMDIQLWWKNRLDGKFYPLYMYSNATASGKIGFFKKNKIGINA